MAVWSASAGGMKRSWAGATIWPLLATIRGDLDAKEVRLALDAFLDDVGDAGVELGEERGEGVQDARVQLGVRAGAP